MSKRKLFTKRRIMALLCCLALMMSLFSLTAFAAENNSEDLHLVFQLDETDVPTPQTITRTYDNGVTQTITMTPAPATRSEPATENTWIIRGAWTFVGVEVCVLTYKIDLKKSGNEWTIENARDLTYEGTFVNVRNKSLAIGRATSTPNYAATVSGQADVTILENQYITIGNATPTVTTNVKNGQVDIVLSGLKGA